MKEANRLKHVLLAGRDYAMTLFRINVGQAWTGNKVTHVKVQHRRLVKPGTVIIEDARPFRSGVPVGYPDVSGWTLTEITPEMVGKTIPVFTVFEVKTPRGRATVPQQRFLDRVTAVGGIAGIARVAEDLGKVLQSWKQLVSS